MLSPMPPATIKTLDAAINFALDEVRQRPERDALALERAVRAGERRRHPVMYLNHQMNPADTTDGHDDWVLPAVEMADDAPGRLAREVVKMLSPLAMDNPVSLSARLGRGTGTLVACFGIPLNPEAGDAPAHTLALDALLAQPPPAPASSGLMPEIRARIAFLKSSLPAEFKIEFPDMQGPFNLAHAMLGDAAFTAPLLEPDKFTAAMTHITDLWLAVHELLLEWIGAARLNPLHHDRICLCSANMISPEMYVEHVLPHDLRIAAKLGRVHVHHCSGPHVFRAAFEHLPAWRVEAGKIEMPTAAGSATVPDVLAAIAGRPDMALAIGEELPRDFAAAYEVVSGHFKIHAERPRVTFGYTGMHWRKQDRPAIRDLHARLDRHWAELYLA